MKVKNLFKISAKAIVSMALVVLVGCDRDDSDVGLPYVNGDNLNFGQLEVTPIVTYTTTYDSVRSNNPETGVGLVGGYNDPHFGRTDAAVATHLLPSGVPSFGTNPVCDSAFLFIPYTTTDAAWYGDTAQPFQIYVHTLRDYMDPDSNFYSNRAFPTDMEIANEVVNLRPRKRINYEHASTARPTLRVTINNSFVENTLFPLENTSAYESSDNFMSSFYGIQLSSDQSAEALIGLLMPSSDTKLRFYFHNEDGDTSYYDLKISSTGEFINTYQHDYSAASFTLSNQDSINGENYTYAQGLGGVATAIEIPNIKDYQDSAWILNRAELVLPVAEGSVLNYNLPDQLLIVRDNAENRTYIADYALEGQSYVDGNLVTGELRDQSYNIVLTRQIQRYLDDKDSTVRFLVFPWISDDISNPEQRRVVFNGNLNPTKPAQLKLYYTRTR